MTDTLGKKLEGLMKDYRFRLIKNFSQNKYLCNYCAEAVVAAKLHALYNGIFTLVLPKDTDKIEMLDKIRLSE